MCRTGLQIVPPRILTTVLEPDRDTARIAVVVSTYSPLNERQSSLIAEDLCIQHRRTHFHLATDKAL